MWLSEYATYRPQYEIEFLAGLESKSKKEEIYIATSFFQEPNDLVIIMYSNNWIEVAAWDFWRK